MGIKNLTNTKTHKKQKKMFSSILNQPRYHEPSVFDCYESQPVEHVGYDFWGNPVYKKRQQMRPRTSYQPRPQKRQTQQIERTPFGEIFGDFGGFGSDWFGEGHDDFFGLNRQRKNYGRTQGKENADPRFNYAKNSQYGCGEECRCGDRMDTEKLPVPERPAQEYTPAPAPKAKTVKKSQKSQKVQKAEEMKETKPKFFKKEYSSNFVSANGNSTTINRESVTENDKTDIKVTKIVEDKSGNQQTTSISPEKYESEVKALFEDSDMIIKEIPIETEELPQIEAPKTFEEKIRESTIQKSQQNSDDNKSHRSNESAEGLFGDIKF